MRKTPLRQEEKQKLKEIYINSIITKLAESVDIKIYKKNLHYKIKFKDPYNVG